ncbi:hypothetical protein AMELA_G00253720 [Ameiurus melas]|uniref:Ig-like domain-containing protein n=1 Tax=Ameiurus melas TaxID=219545 RepID=A0A7J5ZQX3_AMEME|nr:hypothetical protein AMELA_G00253720 [Ameiurus melas]
MKFQWFVFRALWILQILPTFSGERLCKSEFLLSSNISTELQSDVLLPCNFNPTLLGSDKTADIAVVWSTRNTTIIHLVEITLQGNVNFWDSKGGRIKTFPNLSESGNVSILLQKVQPYDLGLYRCELFNGIGCRIAYQELHLCDSIQQSQENYQLMRSTVGAFSGGIVLLAVFTTCLLHAKRRQNITVIEADYENVVGAAVHSDRGRKSIENPIYDNSCQPESSNHAREKEGLSSDTPVYATVKKGKIVNRT